MKHEHNHEQENNHLHCSCGHCHNHENKMGIKKIVYSLIFFGLGIFVENITIIKWLNDFSNNSVHKIIYTVMYFIAYMLCGKDVLKNAIDNIRKGDFFDEQFLMSIASIGAIFVGEIAEAVAVMLFYNLGEVFQDYAVDKSRNSIKSLMNLRPDKAFLCKENEIEEVDPQKVSIGNIIEVKPGERVPLDGQIIMGSSYFDTSAITGESVPRKFEAEEYVLAGFINENSVVRIKVTKEYAESAITRILQLTQEASEAKTKKEKFISRFSKVYTPIVCLCALLVAFVPTVLLGMQKEIWIYRALMFLVVSCPCALVISVPLSFFSGIGLASRQGILVKGSNYIESLAKAKTVVFDKTGTLTKGKFSVTKVYSVDKNILEDELIAIAAHAEYYSNHPISKSIIQTHKKDNICDCCEKVVRECFEEIKGFGIKIKIDGKNILIGNKKLMSSEKVKNFDKLELVNDSESGTVVHIAIDGEYKGFIVISDEIKDSSKIAIAELNRLGIRKTVMLTGDNKNSAEKVSKELNIKENYCDLLPEDKVRLVEELMNKKTSESTLIFVGDGINDSPVLARADVGIAMGKIGTDAALEAADVVIMDDNLVKIAKSIKISKSTMKIVNQNIWFSLIVKVGIMIFSAVGITNMWIAVFGDVGVTIVAILNSLRLLGKK